jgi:hypothetical protein
MAHLNKLAPDKSLFKHCQGKNKGYQSNSNDGYVSTSAAFDVALGWLAKPLKNKGFVYMIATDTNLVDCQMTLGKCESEFYTVGDAEAVHWSMWLTS